VGRLDRIAKAMAYVSRSELRLGAGTSASGPKFGPNSPLIGRSERHQDDAVGDAMLE
jgi:hypothetical protein